MSFRVALSAVLMSVTLLGVLPAHGADNASQLSYTAQDKTAPKQQRVAALHQLADLPSQNALVAAARGVKDPDFEIRLAAVHAASPYPFEHRWRVLSPLFSDMVVDVRLAVAQHLVPDYSEMDAAQKRSFQPVLESYIAVLTQRSSPQSALTLADVYRWTGDYDKANVLYQGLSEMTPQQPLVWLGYAESLRLTGQDSKAVAALNSGLDSNPDNTALMYAKAMTHVRLKQVQQGADVMYQAARLAETNSHYWYVNGVMQESVDKALALQSLSRAYELSADVRHLYAVCDFKIRNHDQGTDACLAELATIAPPEVVNRLRKQYDGS